MKITVVTPVLNCVKFIRSTIESVLSQRGDFELEYIIIDAVSTDGTREIINEYKNYCKIIIAPDTSVASAINKGMDLATGDVGAILMGDDTYEFGTLQAVADAFKKNPRQKWLYGRCKIVNEKGEEIRKSISLYKNIIGYFYSRNILLCENYINQPATFWRLDFWRQIGGWHSEFNRADDYHMWIKMASLSSAIHIRKYLSNFRIHAESFTSNFFEVQIDEELKIAGLHATKLHMIMHKLLCSLRRITYRLLSKINKTVIR